MTRNVIYILLTAARNEEQYIERTINSVISQTILPQKWMIISNNTTDSTEEIISSYMEKYDFIKLLSIKENSKRNFASKVSAIIEGMKIIDENNYDFIGILDADITLPRDYYQRVIEKCIENPKIGIAGGDLYDVIGNKIYQMPKSEFSVRGGIQLFSRDCFNHIGGLQPLKLGGEDTVAEIKARYRGFEICVIRNLVPLHHRRTGTGASGLLKSFFRMGIIEYSLGYHPLFQFFKCLRRMVYKPLILGSTFRFSGYWWACLKRVKRSIPDEVIEFLRKEQIIRIKHRALGNNTTTGKVKLRKSNQRKDKTFV